MPATPRFNWLRIILAILAAEIVPIVLLVLIVVVYGLVRSPDSPSPEDFAPRAGNWVGPIGGFFATLFFSWLTARRSPQSPMVHGAAVGIGTAALDFILGFLMGGHGTIQLVFFLSNAGRIIAGILGGLLASGRNNSEGKLADTSN